MEVFNDASKGDATSSDSKFHDRSFLSRIAKLRLLVSGPNVDLTKSKISRLIQLPYPTDLTKCVTYLLADLEDPAEPADSTKRYM